MAASATPAHLLGDRGGEGDNVVFTSASICRMRSRSKAAALANGLSRPRRGRSVPASTSLETVSTSSRREICCRRSRCGPWALWYNAGSRRSSSGEPSF